MGGLHKEDSLPTVAEGVAEGAVSPEVPEPPARAGGGGGDDDDSSHEVPTLESGPSAGGGLASLSDGPRYARSLSPRNPPYVHVPPEKVGEVFSKGSFTGIRSLPNSQFGTGGKQPGGVGRNGGGVVNGAGVALSVPVAAGQRRPTKLSSAPPVFSVFEHYPDEYDRERQMRREAMEQSRMSMEGRATFKCTALPAVPKSAGSFNEFEYVEDPYERAEESERARLMAGRARNAEFGHGPIRAAGKAEAHDQVKARKWEVLRCLTKALKEDWPDCFARCTEDVDGCIQACFWREKIEGDVTTYMNHFFRTNIDVQQFALRKDPTRWGVVVNGGEASTPGPSGEGGEGGAGGKKSLLRFFFIPMWVHVRGSVDVGAGKSLQKKATKDEKWKPGMEPPLLSGRVPFGPTSNGGMPILVHVRTLSRSFKY